MGASRGPGASHQPTAHSISRGGAEISAGAASAAPTLAGGTLVDPQLDGGLPAAQRGPSAAGGGCQPHRAGSPRVGLDARRGYSHEVGPVPVEDGAEGEAVAEGGGHVGDADIAVALALLLAPQLQVLDSRHGLEQGGRGGGGGPREARQGKEKPSPCPAEPRRRLPACGGRPRREEAGKGAGQGRAAATPQGLRAPRPGDELGGGGGKGRERGCSCSGADPRLGGAAAAGRPVWQGRGDGRSQGSAAAAPQRGPVETGGPTR